MNRERFAWIASLALICMLAFHLPGSLAQRDDEYSFVRTLVDIHRQVSGNYVDDISEQKLREAAIDGMLSQLDPYSVYVPPAEQEQFDRMLEGSFEGVGIQLDQLDNGTIEVVSPIDGSPAFEAGVMAGDVLLKVNGQELEGKRLPDVVNMIKGELNSEVTLTVRHATGEVVDLTMKRQQIVVPTVKGYARNPDNTWDYFVSDTPKIGYLRITQFTPETRDNLRGVIDELLRQQMKGLILDLRFNPGGRLDQAVLVIDDFLDEGVIVKTRGRSRPERTEHASVPDTLPAFPMIVLVNEHSASAAEIVAGSLMDNRRALVIGERTYGKGSVQELIPLDGNSGELKLTVAYYYLPSGRLVHRKKDATDWGVEPQIIIPMTDAEERAMMQDRMEQETFKRPVVKESVTRPATGPATQAVVDKQLQQAVTTMVGLIVLQSEPQRPGRPVAPIATTQPTTRVAPDPNVVPEDRLPTPEVPIDQVDQVPTTAPTTIPTTTPIPEAQ
jgi:carboxyl-terminal processing protease